MSPRKKKVPEEDMQKTDKLTVGEEHTAPPADAASGQDPPNNAEQAIKVQPQPKRKAKKKAEESRDETEKAETSLPQRRFLRASL